MENRIFSKTPQYHNGVLFYSHAALFIHGSTNHVVHCKGKLTLKKTCSELLSSILDCRDVDFQVSVQGGRVD